MDVGIHWDWLGSVSRKNRLKRGERLLGKNRTCLPIRIGGEREREGSGRERAVTIVC